ncbi:LysR family transcriptional regulator [Hoeflea ulvae]|uniref:LysR family transcriptional regulator n=1 Tax=Hoeflea ulvae TaxID=2983764 RepID=A0ABT3YC14_9HYPH|nr:LysR family transcriptional regulator [Hoeflea ulvae]MCY0093421.1 LysR family transcriptional regulator [Hoeflea ulvae]
MNLRQLHYFARAVETRNLTKAAEMLSVAQPALGFQIKLLEEELGVPLLIRHSRGVSPTTPGNLLYDRALEILNYVENTRQEISAFGNGERESLILGLTNGTTALLGMDILKDVRKAIPHLQLSLVEEMSVLLIDALERNEIDVAIAYDVPDKPNLIRVPLMSEEVLFLQSAAEEHETDPMTFSEAVKHPLALANERDNIRQNVQETADRLGLSVEIVYEAQSITMLKQLVAEGGVATIMPYASAIDEITLGGLRMRRIFDPPIKRTLFLVTTSRRIPLSQEAAFLDFLGAAILRFSEALGPLAEPFPVLKQGLSQAYSTHT